jgi:succinoglycan biosynthesis protein ExoW
VVERVSFALGEIAVRTKPDFFDCFLDILVDQTPFITVIIPFFQRRSGILRGALASVTAQSFAAFVLETIVVDDGSPIVASDEIDAFKKQYPDARIRVLKQENSGPNTARNTALAGIDPDTKIVAFLDSDDVWSHDHLERAHRALTSSTSCNAYFSNIRHLGADGPSEFERANRIVIENHPVISKHDDSLRSYKGDMIDQIMRANTIFMPTLVIKKELLGVRFEDGFRHGGGDYIYWLKLMQAGANFCFSTKVEVQCGSGVNMWYSNGWGSDGYLKRLTGESEFRALAMERYISNPDTKLLVVEQLRNLRRAVVFDTVHRLVRGKGLNFKELRQYRQRFGLGISDVFSALRSKF